MPVFFPIKQIRESISVKEISKRINNYLSAVFLYKIYFLLMIVLNLVFLFINEIERGRMKVKLRYKRILIYVAIQTILWIVMLATHAKLLMVFINELFHNIFYNCPRVRDCSGNVQRCGGRRLHIGTESPTPWGNARIKITNRRALTNLSKI